MWIAASAAHLRPLSGSVAALEAHALGQRVEGWHGAAGEGEGLFGQIGNILMAQEGLLGRVEYFGFHGLGIGRAVADAEVVEED